MRHHHQPTTVAILGGNPVATNALALLLEGEGYTTRLLEEYPTGCVGELLDGADLLLLAPDLRNGARDVLLSVVRGNSKTPHIPVLTLSRTISRTNIGEALGSEEQEGIVVAWPSGVRQLTQQIEAALSSAPSGEG